jgi:putative oxidoreductase
MSRGSLALRATVGGIMMGHGLQKLKGAFGGPGLEGTEKMMKSLGLHPPQHHARAVALSETVGGALTAAGLLFPLGPSMIIGTMAVAIQKVHLKNGFWISKGGYEFNLLLMASSFALAAQGPGAISLDGIMRKRRSGLGWGLAAAGLGLGAAAATLKVAESMAPPPEDGTATGPSAAEGGTAVSSGSAHNGSDSPAAEADEDEKLLVLDDEA